MIEAAPHRNGRDELVQVDVQHPVLTPSSRPLLRQSAARTPDPSWEASGSLARDASPVAAPNVSAAPRSLATIT